MIIFSRFLHDKAGDGFAVEVKIKEKPVRSNENGSMHAVM